MAAAGDAAPRERTRSFAAYMLPRWEAFYGCLSGRPATRISLVETLTEGVSGDSIDKISLPEHPPYDLANRDAGAWYRLALAHRAAHYAYGSFSLHLDRLALLLPRALPPTDDKRADETDLGFFLRQFADPTLAETIFLSLEDLRVDSLLSRRLAGIGEDLDQAVSRELCRRPTPQALSPREAALELLVRRSLGVSLVGNAVAEGLAEAAETTEAACSRLEQAGKTVEDSAIWTLELYRAIASLPNLTVWNDDGYVVRGIGAQIAPDGGHAWALSAVDLEGDEVMRARVALPTFRDGMGMRTSIASPSGRAQRPALFHFGGTDTEADEHTDHHAVLTDTPTPEERPQRPEPLPHEHHGPHEEHYEGRQGALEPVAGRSFLYQEWDRDIARYRLSWCRVWERTSIEKVTDDPIYERAVAAYQQQIRRLRTAADAFVREGRRTVRRSTLGDDVDLDAFVEAITDRRASVEPSKALYISREPMEKDIAFTVLFDLSSSTSERVQSAAVADEQSPAQDAFSADPFRDGKSAVERGLRILDVELDAMAVLLGAFGVTGDQLGVYGFSSSGRDDIEFVVIKDLAEPVDRRVTRRLDGIRPMHSTRIGPAVRHLTRRVRQVEAKTKLLLLVSDGRPYDLDYASNGEPRQDLDYASADTRRALEEAQAAGIRVKVLGIEHAGEEALAQMCGGVPFETLERLEDLPDRISRLYEDVME